MQGDLARLIAWALAHPEWPELQRQFTQNSRLEGAIGWTWELGRSRTCVCGPRWRLSGRGGSGAASVKGSGISLRGMG